MDSYRWLPRKHLAPTVRTNLHCINNNYRVLRFWPLLFSLRTPTKSRIAIPYLRLKVGDIEPENCDKRSGLGEPHSKFSDRAWNG